MQQVVVLGAGVVGLSTALHLLEKFPGQLDLTVVSDRFSPDTTSDKAGAIICLPTQIKKMTYPAYNQDIQRWARATFQKYHSIYRSEENAKVEICLEQGYTFLGSPLPDPWYKDEVFGFRHVELDSVEASLLHVPPETVDVWAFGTYIVETTSYLRWLMEKVGKGGAKFEQRKVSSLNELSSYDIMINCTGLGSRELVGDQQVHPMRGQIVLVKAPWINQWIRDFRENHYGYILPRARNVVLGGTAEPGNWSEIPNPETARDILEKCQQTFPSLRGAEVVGGWAGLRPARDSVRLESCEGPAESLLVHCYGHGGQGVLLSWGCALDIGDIVQDRIQPKANL